jgi:hypothetical protein
MPKIQNGDAQIHGAMLSWESFTQFINLKLKLKWISHIVVNVNVSYKYVIVY